MVQSKPVAPGRCGAFTPVTLYCDRPEDHDGDHRFSETFTGNERLVHRRESDRRTAKAIELAEAAVGWWEDHGREDCHFCGPSDDGSHDTDCPVGDYIEACRPSPCAREGEDGK
jgi:hypothetical protein